MFQRFHTLIECSWKRATLRVRPHRPSRSARRNTRLVGEVLESRLALSGTPLPADVAVTDGSLAAYLAESPEYGPCLPPVAEVGEYAPAPILTEGAIAAADALADDLVAGFAAPAPASDEAEGESISPVLLSFEARRVDGGFVVLEGKVFDDDLGMVNVSFGNLFAGATAMSDSSGNFATYVEDPGYGGLITASAMDGEGNLSNVKSFYLV